MAAHGETWEEIQTESDKNTFEHEQKKRRLLKTMSKKQLKPTFLQSAVSH